MKALSRILISAYMMCAITIAVSAQNAPAAPQPPNNGLDMEAIKQANNPLAPKKTFNVHNYATHSLYGVEDATMNSLMLRYAQPIGPIFLRATMPFTTLAPVNSSPTTGFGDFSVFAIYKLPNTPEGVSLGIGPMLVAPTGSHGMSQDKWQTGLSAMAFFAKSHTIQLGTLLQWQFSFADKEELPEGIESEDISILTPQIFIFWQLGGGTYLRSTGIWSFDLNSGNYNVPLGLGIGKVIKAGNLIFNIFMEPQYSALAEGMGQPKFQTFIGFNTQF